MAAGENNEVRQVYDSNSENKGLELSSPLKNDFTFLCNGLDSFLESLKLDSELPKGPGPRLAPDACAEGSDPEDPDPGCPPLPTNHPSTPVTPKTSESSKVLLKDYDCPKPLIFFGQTIAVASNLKYTKSIEFVQQPPSNSFDRLLECRFPPQLRNLYKGIKPAPEPEPVPTPTKTRRRRQRNRLSLSDHAFDNDDAHGRRNLLPSDEDLRTTFDKIYNFRGIPYIYPCSRGKSCENPSKCAQQVNSFNLFMEINPKPGLPLHPLIRENIDCVTGEESCIVDELSALVAVTAVQSKKPPLNRLFIPVSYHLKDKIGCLEGIVPKVLPEVTIEEPVRGVVEDLLDFVDRQLSFSVNVKLEYDPDAVSSAENSFSEEPSQENFDCRDSVNPEVPTVEQQGSSERRRKRGKCKEQNKVLRELKKLMNITVTDETEEHADNNDVKCSEMSCSLGCVCSSVHEKYHPPPEHCGNIGCMFKCVCSEKSREVYLSLGDLSKDEKSWHQTVIRKRNNALEIKSGVDRSKRRKKMPSRYENTVTGYVMNRCLDFNLRGEKKSFEVNDHKPSVLSRTPKLNAQAEKPKTQLSSVSKSALKSVFDGEMGGEGEEMAKRNAAVISEKIRKSLKKNNQARVSANNERRLALTMTEKATNLLDVFIWCSIHCKYDCYCMNWIIFGKNNNLVCRPSSFNRFTVDKNFRCVNLEPTDGDCRQVVMYDQAKHCARSAGPLIDYENRNKDPMFQKKLLYLLNNKIISFSNSFFKAKPIATFASDIPLDNYPFSPALTRKITCGVGDVVKISSAPNEFVDVGSRNGGYQSVSPLDDLNLECSEDEFISKSDFLLDDDVSEFIPKPKKRRLQSMPMNQFCFSSVFKNKMKPPENHEDKPQSSHEKPDYDSDVELVEDPIETYSLTSSPEPVLVDGGTLSDSDSCKDFSEDNEDLSMNSKCDTSNGMENSNAANRTHENSKFFTNKSAVEDNCDSFSSPGKLVIDESFNTLISPEKSVSSHTSLNSLDEPLVNDKSQQRKSTSSAPTQAKISPSPKTHREYPSSESDTITVEVEDEGYPKLGLFCMSLPYLGYLKVKESRPGNFIMEDPHDSSALRTFRNCKDASDFMKKLVSICINPEFSCSEWVMVTRGVLEKYQSKRFDSSQVGGRLPPKKIAKKLELEKSLPVRDTVQIASSESVTTSIQGKIIKKNFDLRVQQNNSKTTRPKCDDIFQSSHRLLTGKDSTAAEKAKPLSGTLKLTTPVPTTQQPVAVPIVKNLVGTFPNLSEANSFIEKNFQPRLYVRPCIASTTQTTGTVLTARTTHITGNPQIAGKFVRLAPPMLSGPRVRGGVPTNKGVRTVLIRGPGVAQPSISRPTLHVRPALAGMKVSSAVVQTQTVATIVSTTDAEASKNQVDTNASSLNSMKIDSSVAADIIGPTTVLPAAPLLSFPIKSCPKGTVLISTTSAATTLKQGESISSGQVQGVALSVTSSTSSAAAIYQDSVSNSVSVGIRSNRITSSFPVSTSICSTTSMNQIENTDAVSSAGFTGSVATLIATPVKQSKSIAASPASLLEKPVKKDEIATECARAADSSPAVSVSSDIPITPKNGDPPKVPGTFVIESFSTSSSPLPSTSSPSTVLVRHCRPSLPKPVIPKVPPRRADVIVPRSEDFATLISPAPSETSPAPKVLTPSENKVFNGVLLPKTDRKEAKAYICHKNPTTKSSYRSLLQKR